VLIGATTSEPLAASAPDQPPLRAQDDTFLLDHLSVEVLPAGMVVAVAVKVTAGVGGVGAGVTVITAVARALPPAPVQVSVTVVVLLGAMPAVPLIALVPAQPPLAVHAVAFLLVQVSSDVEPETIVDGFAASVTVGAGVGWPVGAAATVIAVASHGDFSPAESVAHTLKLYWPATVGVPVKLPFGLTIMPCGGVPVANVSLW
jgi:hypothetical protein